MMSELSIYFAPLEGVTDHIFRKIHREMFGGVEKYFIPFVTPTQNFCWTKRQLRDISPGVNDLATTVPQLMASSAENFLWGANSLADMGYTEVNLNAGCPSGTVTAKRKGAGMLMDRDFFRRFLDGIFGKCSVKISVKTRIGFYSPDEAEALADLYRGYPLSELIVHPRVRQEQYSGTPHMEEMQLFADMPFPVIYNGDLLTAEDIGRVRQQLPFITGIMAGRGMVGNPNLPAEYRGKSEKLSTDLGRFYGELEKVYASLLVPQSALPRLKEVLRYMEWFVESTPKLQKGIRRSSNLSELHQAAMALLSQPLRQEPFNPNLYPGNEMRI